MKERFSGLLAWAKRNERHIATAVFIFGFVSDIATYVLIPVSVANLLFVLYLALSALCTVGSHYLESHKQPEDSKPHFVRRTLEVILPLGAQYFLGGLLSGFLIFYTKSAVLFVSWPFLVFLLLVFIGNELFRDYRTHLAFQTILFFFSLYVYSIFALPILVHTLGPGVFLESTAVSVGLFLILLAVLALAGLRRLRESLPLLLGGTSLILACVVGSYFTGLIPPIPLTLDDGAVYYSLTRTSDGYQVAGEAPLPWWEFWQPVVVHHVPGRPLYAFSAVFAPVKFSTSVVHEWQHYDAQKKRWETAATITFPLAGGRAGGYRGYSELSTIQPGKWRVRVETPGGQVIGQIPFTVEEVSIEPPLTVQTK